MRLVYAPKQILKSVVGRRIRVFVILGLLSFVTLITMLLNQNSSTSKRESSRRKIAQTMNRQQYIADLLLMDKNSYLEDPDPVIKSPSVALKPVFLAMDPTYTRNVSEKHRHHLMVHSNGRLGNLMFAYASMLGIAERNHMIPTLASDNPLRKYFKITTKKYDAETMTEWFLYEDNLPCGYEPTTEDLNYELDIALIGYFQSWKYFDFIKHQIRAQFVFNDDIEESASIFISNYFHQNPTLERNRTILVGVHIRRGDMLADYNIDKGYTVASVQYINSALKYFSGKYRKNKVLFVVCSDDIPWAKNHLDYANGTLVVFSNTANEAIDLAILSKCNHVVMTVGTYSWWAAWLAGGETLYYKRYPQPLSPLSDIWVAEDYFYPTWIGL